MEVISQIIVLDLDDSYKEGEEHAYSSSKGDGGSHYVPYDLDNFEAVVLITI